MRLRLLISLCSMVVATAVFGTAQSPDRLIYQGQTYDLHTNPLERYFAEHPDRHPREANDGDSVALGSGLWRGYIATFEIKDNTLRLRDFEVRRQLGSSKEWFGFVSEIDRFFDTPESRQMNWYSGILVLPQGEMKQYVHLSYASIFESYTLLRIENGRVTDMANMSGEEFVQFKHKQFAVYRESDEYRRVLDELRDEDNDEYLLEQFVFNYGDFVESVMLDFNQTKTSE